jgi:hypothetical protein
MDEKEATEVREQLSMVMEWFEGKREELGTVRFFEMLAQKLSGLAQKKPAWGWRYVQGVHAGSIGPSAAFAMAVRALGATLDDAPVMLTYTVEVRVLARPGTVPSGALVLGEARPCQWKGCRVLFVPKVPWQKYCSYALHVQAERECRQRIRNEYTNGKAEGGVQ